MSRQIFAYGLKCLWTRGCTAVSDRRQPDHPAIPATNRRVAETISVTSQPMDRGRQRSARMTEHEEHIPQDVGDALVIRIGQVSLACCISNITASTLIQGRLHC